MKTTKIELREVKLGTLSGASQGWLIVGQDEVIHGMAHPIDGELFTISSTTDPRIQAFGWCPMFDSLAHVQNDLEIALAMQSAAEVEEWIEQSERYDDDSHQGHLH
ncbi:MULTISPECIES: hypothetical protein [Thalassospira]|uniref:hypothetical protein n=1 Tax=Thalassospira TaxID=168934 RepID=UPI000C9AFADA|nr:hypothetical protein [Thalassospira sp. GB04J01]|tara:strand:+ start:2456 stop:2773 length:318 start_codon:yes stop_codon:yes gene_type:complete